MDVRKKLHLARTASASTVGAFNDPSNFQLALGDSADAVGSEVGVSRLDATQAAQVLVALLLPLGNQVLVCIAFLYTVLIQLSADGFPFVEEVEDVSTSLMVQPENRPQGLHLSLSFVGLCFRFSHFLIQFVQSGLNELPAVWGRLPTSLHFRHFVVFCRKFNKGALCFRLDFANLSQEIGRAHV